MAVRRVEALRVLVTLFIALCLICAFRGLDPAIAADFVVDSAGDGADTNLRDKTCADANGQCTLRAAIAQINALGQRSNAIRFTPQIASRKGISPASKLPEITRPVHISGLQRSTDCGAARQAKHKNFVTLNGARAGGDANGLSFGAGSEGSVVEGLAIINFGKSGIRSYESRLAVHCNYLGVQEDGRTPGPNRGEGIYLWKSGGSRIGTGDRDDRNIISGNQSTGLRIENIYESPLQVSANFIGTDESGVKPLPNQATGIYLSARGNIDIGGSSTHAGNVISGNRQIGIHATKLEDDTVIRNNLIGPDHTGSGQLGEQMGILVNGQMPTGKIAGNVIGWGQYGPGLKFTCSPCEHTPESMAAIFANGRYAEIKDNKFGTNKHGLAPAIVHHPAIVIDSASYIEVSGNLIVAQGASSAIELNNDQLVQVSRPQEGPHHTQIVDNVIGTDLRGEADFSLGATGIHLPSSADNTIVRNNRISAAGGVGIMLDSNGNTISGNDIGLELILMPKPSNAGILVTGSGNEITGNAVGHHVIGIEIDGARENSVRGNAIGTDLNQESARGNSSHGIRLKNNAQNNRIGGDAEADFNLIFNNGGAGIAVRDGSIGFLGGNLFGGNGGLPIDNGQDGADANDVCDQDAGPNLRQNAPQFGTAQADGQIGGVLQSRPNRTYIIDIHKVTSCAGNMPVDIGPVLGQVKTFAGPSGEAEFSLSASDTFQHVAATASDAEAGTTSEFSACLAMGESSEKPESTACEAYDDLLENAKIRQLEDGLILGASAAALTTPQRVQIQKSDAHDVPFKDNAGTARRSDYIKLSAAEDIAAPQNEGFVIGFRRPEGAAIEDLAIMVLTEPGSALDMDNDETVWRQVYSYDTAGADVIAWPVADIPKTGLEAILVERTGGPKSADPSSEDFNPFDTLANIGPLADVPLDPRTIYPIRCDPLWCPEDLARNLLRAVAEAHHDFVVEEGLRAPPLGLPDIVVPLDPAQPSPFQNPVSIILVPKVQGTCGGRRASAYITADKRRIYVCYDASTQDVSGDLRHEFFHAIQAAYDLTDSGNLWLLDGTATLAEQSARHWSNRATWGVPVTDEGNYVARSPERILRDSSTDLFSEKHKQEYETQDFWAFTLEQGGHRFNRFDTLFGAANDGIDEAFETAFGVALGQAYHDYNKNRMYEGHNSFDGMLDAQCNPELAEDAGQGSTARHPIGQREYWVWSPGGIADAHKNPAAAAGRPIGSRDMASIENRWVGNNWLGVKAYSSAFVVVRLKANPLDDWRAPDNFPLSDGVVRMNTSGKHKFYRPSDGSSCTAAASVTHASFDAPSDHAEFSEGQELYIVVTNDTHELKTYRFEFSHKIPE